MNIKGINRLFLKQNENFQEMCEQLSEMDKKIDRLEIGDEIIHKLLIRQIYMVSDMLDKLKKREK